ncbi:hypothetical protein EDB92DRAFT_1944426 [Lactarius akahatsu]|uniref:Uncharacterized protein n=1 Tax=Lactarius akahatsu TaxID=416441 RepID=A0AAD4QEL4_9AGAM|nr:hypothetical protein EDB92DRAFT_1944426 [Lactarius akahatsu]
MSSDSAAFDEYYDQYKVTVYGNLFVGIVYGVYIVLYVTSVHILLRKPDFTSSRPRMSMFGITTFMFVLGIIALVIETALLFQEIQAVFRFLFDLPTPGNLWSEHHINVALAVKATATRLMAVQYILSDIVCAWRAVVLWNRDKRVIAILLLFILGTTAAAGCELGLSLVPVFNSDLPYYSPAAAGLRGTVNFGPLIMVGPTLGTNLLSTGLIAWKAWLHRITIRKYLSEGSGSARVERVFALLIESGFIYCCLWILYLISAFNLIPSPGFPVMNHVLLFVSGLYPTLIIILVAMQKSPVEYYSTHSTGMQFARGPAIRSPNAGDRSGYVYTIRRE